jgi:hypothetical protein
VLSKQLAAYELLIIDELGLSIYCTILRAVMREIRVDWDLSTPGLRESWHAGDLSPFHG